MLEKQAHLSEILELLTRELDVPAELFQKAVNVYRELGAWIEEDSRSRFQADGLIYPQGSVRLGTMVRPIKDEDDYDIDLVYRRDLRKASITQAELVTSTGDQLEDYLKHLASLGRVVPSLEPGKRCWTLMFADFHMDVLPALPDDEAAESEDNYLRDQIHITDRELREWQSSNPKGYANWFDDQNPKPVQVWLEKYAAEARVDVEDVPRGMAKTPLRRGVQLLKRHRDIFYRGNPDDKPISIIITTLAAQAYNGETTMYEVLNNLARNMAGHIELRDGVYWVENPVNPEENFADRWETHPQRATRFFDWLKDVEDALQVAANQEGLQKVASSLSESFGEGAVGRAVSSYGESMRRQRENGKLKMAATTGTLGTAGNIKVKAHNFFGKDSQS
jgi:hypothetical protein